MIAPTATKPCSAASIDAVPSGTKSNTSRFESRLGMKYWIGTIIGDRACSSIPMIRRAPLSGSTAERGIEPGRPIHRKEQHDEQDAGGGGGEAAFEGVEPELLLEEEALDRLGGEQGEADRRHRERHVADRVDPPDPGERRLDRDRDLLVVALESLRRARPSSPTGPARVRG